MCTFHDSLTIEYHFRDIEKKWLDFLENATEEVIEQQAESTDDGWFFDNYSAMRTSVWQWYPFRKEASVLEIGAGYGTVTGVLCDKCARVVAIEKYRERAYLLSRRYKFRENLDIYMNDISVLGLQGKFDYIVLNGSFGYQCDGSRELQDYVRYLEDLKGYLKEDGVILLTADNRLGVQFLCGKPAPSTGVPFDTLMNYPCGSKYHCFVRSELLEIAEAAGFTRSRIYYPMPDWKYMQELYSDDYSPSEKVVERVVNNYTYAALAVGDERVVLQEFIRNKDFATVANSFLVEMTSGDAVSDIVYATCTTDRGREHSFVTVLHGAGTVEKWPVYEQGLDSLRSIYNNHEELRVMQIPVIDQLLEDGTLTMPRMIEPTLSETLMKANFQSEAELFGLFDKLHSYITKASLGMGAVYIDMVPFNCFFTEDGELLFFDQEFKREDCTEDYVMFRALMYSYAFAPALEQVVPLAYMQRRYGLEKVWNDYQEMERAFVADNRRYDKNRLFWNNTYLDPQQLLVNKNRLRGQGPVVQQALVPTDGDKKYNLGYIAGVFDLFHVGHLNLVRNAKAMCNQLIVGVLTDELVEHFKNKRPYIPQKERMEILAATRFVDGVVSVDFSNIDKIDAWNLYHFDCLFSGDDWKDSPKWNEDREKLRALGSDIHFFEYTKGTSSTQIKQLMSEK